MNNNKNKAYFKYLKTRKKLKKIIFDLFVYPRLSKYLKGRVLDIGCGIGDFLAFRPDTTGLDVNPYNVSYCQGLGFESLQIDEDGRYPFDGAIMDNVLEHIETPDPVIDEIRRVLKPGGTLIIGVPGKYG